MKDRVTGSVTTPTIRPEPTARYEECASFKCGGGENKTCLCQTDIDCDDKNDCTEDECNAGGYCIYSSIVNCGEIDNSDS